MSQEAIDITVQTLNFPTLKTIRQGLGIALLFLLVSGVYALASPSKEDIRALYIPPSRISARTVTEVLHYARQVPINGVVIHVKDPFGRISWKSQHYLANEINSRFYHGNLAGIVEKFKAEDIWTIAKIDVFADHALVAHNPDMGLKNGLSGTSWKDKNGLHWTNPYDERVWAYIISLAKEVAALGFDEIQFDYIRFPSDGNLSAITYPKRLAGVTRAKTIGRFLKTARTHLKPLDVALSVDLFGLVAWKRKDFGIGQVVEEIAPHVDVICPMFYPSHFPSGFLGKKAPGDYPYEIMLESTKRLMARTNKIVRPWIQGFWYKPQAITAQINGITKTGTSGYLVWNPSGRYKPTYTALAQANNVTLSDPVFYPSVAELKKKNIRVTAGNFKVINFTDYQKGFSILSLEHSKKGHRNTYTYPAAVVGTIDEGIMDRILMERSFSIGKWTTKNTKKAMLIELLVKDLKTDPRRMRPIPIYIDWENSCRFSSTPPGERLSAYKSKEKTVFAPAENLYMSQWSETRVSAVD